jgi:ppGpp synthetase/RelA/SpoT-type nucleotidyltranferase
MVHELDKNKFPELAEHLGRPRLFSTRSKSPTVVDIRTHTAEASNMVWAVPQYSRERVNEAGRVLESQFDWGASNASTDDIWQRLLDHQENLAVVNNWRSSHSYPMNTFQATLRKRAAKIDRSAIFATRIKRLESIQKKLEKREEMKLTQMQDIGGLRAILKDNLSVNTLVDVYNTKRLDHIQAKCNDYISNPKPDGYRSVHLIYKYRGVGRTPHYDDLKVEIQIRSVLQHAWATAVETVGIFTKQALKSSEGDEAWLRFFALASSVLADFEGTPQIPGLPSGARRDKELANLATSLNVRELLRNYQTMLRALERSNTKNAKYFLLTLEPEESRISAKGYLTRDSISANAHYTKIEQEIANKPGAQAVLVKVDSISALRRAYPNYFADTTKFVQALDGYI